MKLSTKGRYGLRAVLDLALHCDKEAVPLGSIAERQHISISYLEQLIAKLRKAGIVSSIRGAQGGYVLSKPCEEISVGEILRALEGDLNPVDCAEVAGGSCSGSDLCVTKLVWKRISDSINEAVDELMLSELVEESRQLTGQTEENPNEQQKSSAPCGQG